MALGTINKEYISSISMLDQRELLNQLLDVTNEDFSFLEVMGMKNKMKSTVNHQYHAFRNTELFTTETVKTGTTPTDNSGGSGQGASFRVVSITDTEALSLNTDLIVELQNVQIGADPFSSGPEGANISATLASSNAYSQLQNA